MLVMMQTSILILLVGCCVGLTAGRFVLDETDLLAEDEDKAIPSEGALISKPDVDIDKILLKALLRGEISLEELLGERHVQDLETGLQSGPLEDVGWSGCIGIDKTIIGYRVHTRVCITVQGLLQSKSLYVTIQIGLYVHVRKLSVFHLPELCFGIPGISLLKACIQFYNINTANLSGCVRARISLFYFYIGCFDFVHTEKQLSYHPHDGQLITMLETVKESNMTMVLEE